jgi:type IV secretory pathway VirB10-like protein
MMSTPLLRAEVDTFQAAIIVLAVIFSFLKWLWENWQQKKADAESQQRAEMIRRIREDSRKPEKPEPAFSAKPFQQPSPPPPPAPSAPAAPSDSPWEEVRQAWRELLDQQRPPKPAPSAAKPARRDRGARPPHLPAPAAVITVPSPASPVPVVAAPADIPFASTAPSARQPSPLLTSLLALRGNPAAMRQAIVLSEVIGPPKALA